MLEFVWNGLGKMTYIFQSRRERGGSTTVTTESNASTLYLSSEPFDDDEYYEIK